MSIILGDKKAAEHVGLVLLFYVHGLMSTFYMFWSLLSGEDLIFSANLVSQLINNQRLARFFHMPECPAIA